MCAHLLQPEPHAERARRASTRASERGFDGDARASTTAALEVGAAPPAHDAARHARAPWRSPVVLALIVPEGLLPAAGHRAHHRRHRGGARRLVPAHDGAAAARSPTSCSHDPDVATVASFIGADGTNATHQQRAPLDHAQAARASATRAPTRSSRASAEARAGRRASTLYLQPVQDLQIDSRVSRTQFQYTLEDADPDELAQWAPQDARASCARCPSCATSPAISRAAGLELALDDRSRHRVAPRRLAAGDRRHALRRVRPAAGLDHLHAAQPVPRHPRGEARVPAGPRRARSASTCASPTGEPVPLGAFAHVRADAARRSRSTTRASSRRSRSRSTSRRGVSLGDAVDADRRGARRELGLPPGVHADFQGAAQAFRESLASEPLLILAALITVYIVLGVLYESYIHPITILSTLPSAGVGALLALMVCRHRVQRHRADRHHPPHRHREEERDHDDRLRARGRARPGHVAARRRSTRRACCASGRS